MAADLLPYVLLIAAILILGYIADILSTPESVVPDPRSVRVECDPWSYAGRHRIPEERPASRLPDGDRDSRLRTAPYVVNPPYRSLVATVELSKITRRELVNARRGGEER